MRRAFYFLKYVPAVLCGLLLAAQVVSPFYAVGYAFQMKSMAAGVSIWSGLLDITCLDPGMAEGPNLHFIEARSDRPRWYLGKLAFASTTPPTKWYQSHLSGRLRIVIFVPILLLLTLFLPLALAPFTRLPLWSYFAYTALIAAELAYYLR
jgi:hypothetical protein